MRYWSFWEWLAYTCLLVGAIILAADTGLKVAPELAHRAPWIESFLWSFAPLVLVSIATLILVERAFGWVGAIFGGAGPLRLFLERDSVTNQAGIQTFPQITYIQISVAATKQLMQCKAWYRRSDYSPDGIVPFALEHNERHALPWSKSGMQTAINPTEPPVRINVAVFNEKGLEFDPGVGTPSNLHPQLQRSGIHRFEISVSAFYGDRETSETRHLFIDWRGAGPRLAFIELKRR